MASNGAYVLLSISANDSQQRMISTALARAGWRTTTMSTPELGAAFLTTHDGMTTDAIVLDVEREAMAQSIAELRSRRPGLPILALIEADSPQAVVTLLRAGASDYLEKPITPDRICRTLEGAIGNDRVGELRLLSGARPGGRGFEQLVGESPEFCAAIAMATKWTPLDSAVLIEGESGTGKDSFARAIHDASAKARAPFVTVDCAWLRSNLIESEIFGHEKGAFAGAFDQRQGRLAEAEGGTLFIEHIANMPGEAQAQLLRWLNDSTYRPLGGSPRMARARLIVANDCQLEKSVKAGRFREDLYYRLAEFRITLPPLRDRVGDLPKIASALLKRLSDGYGLPYHTLEPGAIELLTRYDWPGNIRQLYDVLMRVAILAQNHRIRPGDFPNLAMQIDAPKPASAPQSNRGTLMICDGNGHFRTLNAIEADVIRLAISHYRGRMTEVARRLGIGRSTLYRKINELGISDAA